MLDNTTKTIQYWDEQRKALGFETVWSMWDFKDIDQNIFKPGVKRVSYTFGDTEVSSFAISGKVRDIWEAAESCFQQAKQQGDWHVFIEDIELGSDGSYELVMGS